MSRIECEGQLTIELQEKRDPFNCPHLIRTVYDVANGEVVCGFKDGHVYTNCHASNVGDPPTCVWEEPDNSPEALSRRLAWMNDGKSTA